MKREEKIKEIMGYIDAGNKALLEIMERYSDEELDSNLELVRFHKEHFAPYVSRFLTQ